MERLKIESLKKIIENIPDDYEIEFNDRKGNHIISDKIEIDISGKKLIFRKY